jgi:hypothetical protein
MDIEADQDGQIEIKIETNEKPYGYNRKTKTTKRTIKVGPVLPNERMKVEIIKGKIVSY